MGVGEELDRNVGESFHAAGIISPEYSAHAVWWNAQNEDN